jgi:hypothetical protein
VLYEIYCLIYQRQSLIPETASSLEDAFTTKFFYTSQMGKIKYITILLCVFFMLPVFAWSAVGHRVIAQIAYDYLTPKAKRHYAHINQVLNTDRHHLNLIMASVWLDLMYSQQLISFRPLHYIDIPFSKDHTVLPEISPNNAVTAIRSASTTLTDPKISPRKQAIALRILLHVVGDIHQPLHATSRVSAHHPDGDRGGNDFKLGKNRVSPTLHGYWDRGGGLLQHPMSSLKIKQLARTIEAHCICPPENFDAMHWAEESHDLALKCVYALKEKTIPSDHYQQATQDITKHQLGYAGCRLAGLLNHLYRVDTFDA